MCLLQGLVLSMCVFTEMVAHILQGALRNPTQWGAGCVREGQRVVVEYTQPNPFKAFHIGHLMSNTIGEAISRIVAAQGAELVRANYQGDVGPHVAKALWALLTFPEAYAVDQAEDLGKAYARGVRAYEEDEGAKEAIEAINVRLYALLAGEAPKGAQEEKLLELYQRGREASLRHFAAIYQMLDTHFDVFFFESEAAPVGKQIVEDGLRAGVFEESEGAVVFRGERCDPPLHTRVFLTRKGTPTYEAKELGLVKLKQERIGPFDENITTVAVEQESYGRLIACVVARLWPELAGRYRFLTHGLLQLTTGKMSSRTGEVITGGSLLQELRRRALEKMEGRVPPEQREDVATAVAVAAVRFAVLRQSRGKNIRFDPEASLSLTGDSGPYLQYTHARLISLQERAQREGLLPEEEAQAETALLDAFSAGGWWRALPAEAQVVARIAARFPLVLDRAHEELEPSLLAQYLLALAGAVNRWYDVQPIVRPPREEALPRLAVLAAARASLARGLTLLGITPLEMM
jgi:arginyl-tRNA synthetase